MSQTFILGRRGTQPFKIDPSLVHVHGEHARLTVGDRPGDWYVEDLKGTGGNGVYVRNRHGEFDRVYSCHISPNDILRLGPEGARSVTFMARRVLDPSLYYEFSYVRKLDEDLRREEAEHNATIKSHNRNQIIAPLIGVLSVVAVRLSGLVTDMAVLVLLPSLASGILGILRYKYRNDSDRLKQIRAKRSKFIICPQCGRPLSDYDVRNSRCSVCKAM